MTFSLPFHSTTAITATVVFIIEVSLTNLRCTFIYVGNVPCLFIKFNRMSLSSLFLTTDDSNEIVS